MNDVGSINQFWHERPSPAGANEPADRLLSIGEFARRSWLSTKALRLYDRLALLTPDRVDQATGYRQYRESQLGVARMVAMLRRLDMPLALVARIVSAPRPLGAQILASYWQGVEQRIAFQRELAAHVRIRLSDGEGVLVMFDNVQQRKVPEQLVLTELRHTHVDGLAAWLDTAMVRLDKTAQSLGGTVAPQFVVFHGEVNQDSDGPVEICTPIDPSHEGASDEPMRREPAHREAYVRLRKAQVEYPQILSAYDAVAQWINANGLTTGGPPREVYFTDFHAAAPTDEVCDVAYPIE